MQTTIVIPCYNEAARLDLEAFRAFVVDHPWADFLFVDDGSTDRTGALLLELSESRPESIRVSALDRNAGKAEAVRRGMQQALRSSSDLAGYWDADLATPLSEVERFRNAFIRDPQLEIAMGSRVRLLGRNIVRSMRRHYVSRVAATLISHLLGISVYDTQCGAKIFRVTPGLGKLFADRFVSRWLFDVEILARWLCDHPTVSHREVDQCIHELPLWGWIDAEASRLRPADFIRAPMELFAIYRNYSIQKLRS